MVNRRQRVPVRVMTPEEKRQCVLEVENSYPGYMEENVKLTTIVRILTGLRILYGLFYLYMSHLYGMGGADGWLNLLGAFFFLMWYSLMLRSGKMLAVAMLVFRGFGIAISGSSIISISPWLPLPLIFTLMLAVVMEFSEAVFCIYVLFNATAARTVRLNYQMDRDLVSYRVPKETLEKMAEYRNPYSDEDGDTDADTETNADADTDTETKTEAEPEEEQQP